MPHRAKTQPHAVFLAAAKVGGILANDTRPAEFLYENLMIESNIIDASYRAYEAHPLSERDEWGDLASFRTAAGAS